MMPSGLHVTLWVWILSQVIGVVVIVVTFISYQQRRKSKQLQISVGYHLLDMVANLMLLNFAKAGMSVVASVKNFFFASVNKDGAKESKQSSRVLTFVVFSAINTAIMVLIWAFISYHWFDWFLLVGVLGINYAKAAKGIHKLKIGILIFAIIEIINLIMFLNIIGIVAKLIAMMSIVIFYVRFFKSKSHEEKVK